jgi:hypothetical protein
LHGGCQPGGMRHVVTPCKGCVDRNFACHQPGGSFSNAAPDQAAPLVPRSC